MSALRVLYSFPIKLGGERICGLARHQVNGLSSAGADVLVFPAALHTAVAANIEVRPTLARGRVRIPFRLLGRLPSYALHDYIVSRRIEALASRIDIIHTWPLGALRTLKMAAKLGIPTVLERPNAYTHFAFEEVRRECELLAVNMPAGHEHAYNENVLHIEEDEYRLATQLLCPSEFVVNTFLDAGFPQESLARHQYGFDEKVFYPSRRIDTRSKGLTALFAGGCAPRKGLHYALEAWLKSPASQNGQFLIAGSFIPGYAEKLSQMLSHSSVKVLGHRNDLPELMRKSDVFLLPSIEEGSALVTYEARGSGCVLLVSDATGAVCEDGTNALVHRARDVESLTRHISLVHSDRRFLQVLRETSLRTISEITWEAAGVRLLNVYKQTIQRFAKTRSSNILGFESSDYYLQKTKL